MGTVAWGVSFGEWGDSWGSSSTAASVGGGSYKSKRRVLIGKETLYVTDQELSVILQQMLDEPKNKPVNPAVTAKAPPTPLESDAQPGAGDPVQLPTGNSRQAATIHAPEWDDEEDIEMLVLH